jgi:hypothetical protein
MAVWSMVVSFRLPDNGVGRGLTTIAPSRYAKEAGMRKSVFMLAETVLTVLVASGVAYAAVIKGTAGDDRKLEGTPKADNIYGHPAVLSCQFSAPSR